MFKKIVALVVFASFFWILPVFGQEVKTVCCDQIVTAPNFPSMTMRFFMKGEDFRIETNIQGQEVVMLKSGNRMFTYYPAQHMAMEMPLSQSAIEKMSNSPFGKNPKEFKEYLDQIKTNKIGEEFVEGRLCDVYEFPAENGKAKVWIVRELNWPAKAIMPSPKGDIIVEYRNIKINQPLDDSLFNLPAGVNMMNMGEMIKGAQEIMNNPEMQRKMEEMMDKYKKK